MYIKYVNKVIIHEISCVFRLREVWFPWPGILFSTILKLQCPSDQKIETMRILLYFISSGPSSHLDLMNLC